MRQAALILIISSLFFSCRQENPTSSAPTENTSLSMHGELSLSFQKSAIPQDVAVIIANLQRTGYETIRRTMTITSDTTAEVMFTSIVVGTWTLDVKAYGADSVLRYQGSASVAILDGQTTQVNLTMTPVTTGVGSIIVHVVWGSSTAEDIWIDGPANPLLRRQNTMYDGRGVGYPFILKESDHYKMYYTNTASPPDSLGRVCTIGLALSADGNTWKHYSTEPVFMPSVNGWDNAIVTTGSVIKENGIYRMYYTAASKNATSSYAIGLATSSDGIHWERRTQPVFKGTSGWENNSISTFAVLKVNNEYRMYYNGGYPLSNIGLATSSDGITWTRYSTTPVLKPTATWEASGLAYASVWYENGKYTMLYINGDYTPKFGIAISVDGIQWTKSAKNPIFTHASVKNNWAPYSISYPSLTKINGEFRFYYSGAVSSSYEYTIGYAYNKGLK